MPCHESRSSVPRDYLYAESENTAQIDGKTCDLIELGKLNDCLDDTRTLAGRITLSYNLGNPSTDLEHIRARQAALREIIENEELRSGLESTFATATRYQEDFHRLFFGRFMGLLSEPGRRLEYQGYGYTSFRYGTRFLPSFIDGIEQLPAVESTYLNRIIANLKDFKSTWSHALLAGPVYLRPGQIMPPGRKKLFSFRFKPSPFKLSILLLLALMFYAIPVYLEITPTSASLSSFFMFMIILFYLPVVGSLDRDHVIYPFRKLLLKAGEVEKAVQGVGQLDELMSFYQYFAANRHKACVPELRDAERCVISLSKVKHPVSGCNNEEYVANDLSSRDKSLVFISGPNSGGKTVLCKALALTQIMAQSGSFILATAGTLNITDRIYYQAPETGSMPGGEGRFGTELRRTREIFFNTTKKSLVFLDELSEGTTHREETEIACMILEGFLGIGNTTILVSHNHELAEIFKEQNSGIFYQFGMENDNPTFVLAEGISKYSYARAVAKKIGFSKADINLHLEKPGSK